MAGCSAGSVGSAFHADSIIKRYPRARVTQVGDSLAFVYHRPISLASWGTHTRFPSWFKPARANGRWTMTEFVTALARNHPRRTFARFNHARDGVQVQFYVAVGGQADGFEPQTTNRRADPEEAAELPLVSRVRDGALCVRSLHVLLGHDRRRSTA